MSAIALLVGPHSTVDPSTVETMLASSPERGGLVRVWYENGVALGASAQPWELPADDRVEHRVAVGDRWVVAADASLYGVGSAAAAHILTALDRDGPDCLRGLVGDFAFVAYERTTRRVFAARDFTGKRSLFMTKGMGATAFCTTLRGLERLPWLDRTLNLIALAEDALYVDLAYAQDTAYRSVARIPAGHQVEVTEGATALPTATRWWDPPIFERGPALPFEEAAEALRELLIDASGIRTDARLGTAVWLSGGYDSTAVFGGASEYERRRGRPPVRAVSLSHPEGDEGREDEFIRATTDHWNATPTWREIASVPGIDDPLARAAARDEPFTHPYELWNRALARATRDAGARIALGGNGGDQFFSVSPLYFADLVRTFRWWSIRREFRERFGAWNWDVFFRMGIQPLLSPLGRRIARRLRGGPPLRHYLYRRPPSWVRQDFARTSGLLERRDVRPPRRSGEGHSAWEHAWHLRAPFGDRVESMQFQFALSEGVEMRSPLFDERIIRLAATRPREESNSRGQNKHLLRAASRPLLPPSVTAPRPKRTGNPSSYFQRTLRDTLSWYLQSVAGESRLSGLGIVDDGLWRGRMQDYLEGRRSNLEEAAAAIYSIHAELWLRARS